MREIGSWAGRQIGVPPADATNAITQNGNTFGTNITIGPDDNFDFYFQANGSTKMYLFANGFLAVGANKLTVDPATSRVGINTGAPDWTLDCRLLAASGDIFAARISGQTKNPGFFITADDAAGTVTFTGSGTSIPDLIFATGTTEAFRITSDTKIAFFAETPAAQQTSAAITNSVTTGGTTDVVDNVVAAGVDVTAAELVSTRNAMYQLARKVKEINDLLRAYGLIA